jgi:hypothetical protein
MQTSWTRYKADPNNQSATAVQPGKADQPFAGLWAITQAEDPFFKINASYAVPEVVTIGHAVRAQAGDEI